MADGWSICFGIFRFSDFAGFESICRFVGFGNRSEHQVPECRCNKLKQISVELIGWILVGFVNLIRVVRLFRQGPHTGHMVDIPPRAIMFGRFVCCDLLFVVLECFAFVLLGLKPFKAGRLVSGIARGAILRIRRCRPLRIGVFLMDQRGISQGN